MHYGLAPGISFCEYGERVVVLDARRDRYKQLGAAGAQALRRLAQGQDVDPDAFDRLLRLGVLSNQTDRQPLAVVNLPVVTRSFLEEQTAEEKAPLCEVAWGLACACWAVKRRAFASLLDDISGERRLAGATSRDHAALRAAAASFERRRRLIPVEPVCLPDSLALLRFLHRRSLDADFVLGIRLDPFGAHCWLQAGDVVLNDAVDNVQTFSAIRVC